MQGIMMALGARYPSQTLWENFEKREKKKKRADSLYIRAEESRSHYHVPGNKDREGFGSTGGDEALGSILLLAGRLREGGDAGDDAGGHEHERDDGPDDAPALGGAAVALGEDAGVGAVYFSEDEIVALEHG